MPDTDRKKIRILNSQGHTAFFDGEQLRLRLESAFRSVYAPDGTPAADIALAIEYVLHSRLRNEDAGNVFRANDVELTICRILENLGYAEAAERFRAMTAPEADSHFVEMIRIREILDEAFPDSGSLLDRVTRKVYHTLLSIGASSAAASGLITELGKHFILSMDTSSVPLPVLNWHPSGSPLILDVPEILEALHDSAAEELVHSGILSIRKLDLRIFPVLHLELHLDKLADGLIPPVTELALSPSLIRVAEAMDSIARTADAVCNEKGHENETPLPLAVHFSDSGTFFRNFMDCRDSASVQKCAASLAQLLRDMMIRQPLRFSIR